MIEERTEKKNGLKDPVDSLPKDIILHIFSFLKPKHLAKVALVAKKWNEISKLDQLWKLPCEKMDVSAEENDFKKTFIERSMDKREYFVCSRTEGDIHKEKYTLQPSDTLRGTLSCKGFKQCLSLFNYLKYEPNPNDKMKYVVYKVVVTRNDLKKINSIKRKASQSLNDKLPPSSNENKLLQQGDPYYDRLAPPIIEDKATNTLEFPTQIDLSDKMMKTCELKVIEYFYPVDQKAQINSNSKFETVVIDEPKRSICTIS